MDRLSVCSRTAKGLNEARGKTSLLSRKLRDVLKEVDGKRTIDELALRLKRYTEPQLLEAMMELEKAGFVHELVANVAKVAPQPAPIRPAAAPSVPGNKDDVDLDFTSPEVKPITRATVARQAAAGETQPPDASKKNPRKARLEADTRAEAAARAAAEAAARAREEAEHRAREEAELAARRAQETEERARQEAEELRRRLDEERRARDDMERRIREEAELRIKEQAERQAQREAEENARREAEALRLQLEEERRAREEAIRSAKLEAERIAREAEERAERQAREEAERNARLETERVAREAEEKARKEAEESTRREAEALRLRLEEERKALEEAIRSAKLEAERIAREAEEKARKEAEQSARREAEEHARQEVERRARKEAELAAQRAQKEAEERACQEAEDLRRRLEEERQAREEAEHKAKAEAERAAAQRAQREAEERARQEAERRARVEAERAAQQRAQIEAEELSKRREEERRAREQAERKAKEEAELAAQRAQKEAEESARREAEEREKRLEDERAREEAERATRDAQERARREVEDRQRRQAERDEEERAAERDAADAAALARRQARDDARAERLMQHKADAVRPATPRSRRRWGTRVALASSVLFVGVAVLLALPVVPLDASSFEKAAEAQWGQPVRIGSLRLALFPLPRVRMERVAIGADSQLKVRVLTAVLQLDSIWHERKVLKSVEIEDASVPAAWLTGTLWGKPRGDAVRIERLAAHRVKLEFEGAELLLRELDAELDASGNVQNASVAFSEGTATMRLARSGSVLAVEIAGDSFSPPFGQLLHFEKFSAKGQLAPAELVLSEFDASVLGGRVSGNARMRWGGAWSVEGELTTRGVDARRIASPLLAEGRIDATGSYAMRAASLQKLDESARLEGAFTVHKGKLGTVDFTRVLQGSRSAGGTTAFSEMSGYGSVNAGAVQVRQLRLGAGMLSARGEAVMDARKNLSGQIQIELRAGSAHERASIALAGTLASPAFR